jgi:RNA:NAD 2'-phosphotransferase (TPT1/KptA family)
MLDEKISKTLSYILRHDIGNYPHDKKGFVPVNEILKYMKNNNIKCDIDIIKNIVITSDKKRFTLEEQNNQYFIKANQGHSLKSGIDDTSLELIIEPLENCIHGTENKFIKSILNTSGVLKPSLNQK